MITRRLALRAALSVAAALAAAPPAGAQAPTGGITRKELLRQPLSNAPGKEVVVVSIEFGPGAGSTPHRHPSPVFGYVARGALVSQIGDEPARTYREGEIFYEPPGGVHTGSKNASQTSPATLVAFFVADAGQPLTIPVAG